MAARSWVAFDVDRIQEFVFASTRPIDVTGASELIKDLSEQRELPKWLSGYSYKIVYSHGGSGLLVVEGDKATADQLAGQLERRFREHTLTGSCTAVAYQPNWNVNDAKGFQRLLRVLGMKLQQRKGEKAAEEPPDPWVMSYFRRCQACGLYPAVSQRSITSDPREEQEYVCKSCNQRRERGKEAKYVSNESMPRMAQTLENIAGKESGEEGAGYLAVIYADANRAGLLLRQAENEQQVRAFSDWLWTIVEKSVGEVVSESGLEERYQSPVVGGDDILLFIPASHAVKVLKQVYDKLKSKLSDVPEELTSTELGELLKNLSFSYALLIAPHHLPIPFLYQYAHALLKSSKQLAYQTEGSDAIDFQWITESSPLSESLLDLRRTFHCERQDGLKFHQNGKLRPIDEYWTTAKPYSWKGFEELLGIVEVFHSNKVTKGQLRRLAQLLHNSSPTEAQLNVLYQAVRNEELASALNQLCSSMSDWPKFFFEVGSEGGKQVLRTKLLDILELFELQELAEASTQATQMTTKGGNA